MDDYKATRDPLRLFCQLPVAPYIRRHFARVGAELPQVRVRYSRAGNPPHDVLIERSGRSLTIVLEESCTRLFARSMRHMVAAYAYWLSLADPRVRAITVNASDGDTRSNARFAASVRFDGQVGLPDPHFFINEGFFAERALAANPPAWGARSEALVWRGAMTGNGWFSLAEGDVQNLATIQRLRLVMAARSLDGVDAKLVEIPARFAEFAPLARRLGIVAGGLPAASWLDRRYALDIDGVTNTWSNLFVRLLFGCCVLKVQSQFGYRQWYYDDLRPFEHYVPVKADLSDLAEKWEWARTHPREAQAIAERGRDLALSMTFRREAGRAAALIEQYA